MSYELLDKVPHVLWDSIITQGHLFSVPLGMGESVWGPGQKTLADTNLYIANQLPPGWRMKSSTA